MVQWIFAAPLILLGGGIIVYHWRLVIQFIRVRFFGCTYKRESTISLVGPTLASLGIFLAAPLDVSRYSWLLFFIDPATYLLAFGCCRLLSGQSSNAHSPTNGDG